MICYNGRMTNDYIEDIKKDMARLDWNLHRFFNEPGTWYDEVMKEIEIWLGTNFDLFVKSFTTKTKWKNEPVWRSQYPDMIAGKKVFVQWTLTNGTNMELVVKRITEKQAKNFKIAW